MSQSNPNSEPTMDEILASIRKIISEDQPEAAEANSPQSAAPEPPAEPIAEEATATETSEPVGATEDEPARVDSLSGGLESESLDSPDFDAPEIGAGGESLQEEFSEDEPFESKFISPATRFALDQAFEQMETVPTPAPVAPSSEASVEAVFARAVQEAFDPTLQEWVDNHGEEIVSRLAPLIREWMDENLPPLVEAAVTKEISRAMRSRQR
jgi:hypothetical protein